MVVGESQILGQVRTRCAPRRTRGTAGRLLNDLFQQALRVGKRAHTETGIDRAGRSLVTVGLERGRAALGRRWPAREVLVVGAGSMSALAADRGRPAGRGRRRRRQPHARARAQRLADVGRRRGRRRSTDAAGGARRRPTSSCPAPARSGTSSTPTTRGRRAARPATAGRWSCSTWPCRATSTRPSHDARRRRPSSTSRRSPRRWPTSEHAGRRRGGPRDRRRRGRRVPGLRSAPPASRRPWSRCARWPPTSSRAELARLDRPAARPRRPHARAEIEQTVRRVVDKLLHAPDRAGQAARRASPAAQATPTRCASCSTSTPRRSRPSPGPTSTTDGAGGR